MEILLSAGSYLLTDNVPYGEGQVCYNFLKHMQHFNFHVVTPIANIRQRLPNVTIYETGGYKNPFDPSVVDAMKFALLSYKASKSVLEKNYMDIVHHFLPAQYPRIASFLPFDRKIMTKYPFVVGPISFPTYWPRSSRGMLLDYLSKPFFERSLAEADFIITQTRHTAELVQSVFPNKSIVTVPLGVDTEVFKPNNPVIELSNILAVANLFEKKGINYLIQAFYYVNKEFPDVVLRIIGTGPHEKYLKELTNSLGLSHKVVFFGNVSRDDLIKYYNEATIFCSPSLVEPFGVVILEAMACGKAVVATKTEGAKEIIHDGENGLLVDIGDPKSIAKALLFLLHNRALLDAFSSCARDNCKKRFSWELLAQQYSTVYHSI